MVPIQETIERLRRQRQTLEQETREAFQIRAELLLSKLNQRVKEEGLVYLSILERSRALGVLRELAQFDQKARLQPGFIEHPHSRDERKRPPAEISCGILVIFKRENGKSIEHIMTINIDNDPKIEPLMFEGEKTSPFGLPLTENLEFQEIGPIHLWFHWSIPTLGEEYDGAVTFLKWTSTGFGIEIDREAQISLTTLVTKRGKEEQIQVSDKSSLEEHIADMYLKGSVGIIF